jgi:hypothetical protein
MVQQSARLAANDLPIITAQAVEKQLSTGSAPTDLVLSKKVNLRNDGSVFVTITNNDRNILASSAELNGKTPLPPAGVFEYTKAHGVDNITWQPTSGVRLAMHVQTYSNSSGSGFIITGQSLKQTESHINTFTLLALLGWLMTVIWSSFVLLLPGIKSTTKNRNL